MKTTPIDEKALVPVKRQVGEMERLAGSLVVKTDADAAEATSLLSRVKGVQKAIKAQKDAITKPLNAGLKAVRALFAPVEQRCEDAERLIKGKLLDFADEQERKRLKAEAKVMKQLDSGRIKPETAVAKMADLAPADGPIQGAAGGSVSIRMVREVVVDDEMLLPREYLIPDLPKIRHDALNGIVIPGVEIVERKQVAAR